MGYGVKPPGYFNGKKTLRWRLTEGKLDDVAELLRAFGVWTEKVGVTFARVDEADAVVDFQVKTLGKLSQWSPSTNNTLFLKGTETLGDLLHEVGHLLGMSHEHDRPDRRNTWYTGVPGALGTAESVRHAEVRQKLKDLQTYGEYDEHSIMQYPESKYKAKTEPSAGDIATVKEINRWS